MAESRREQEKRDERRVSAKGWAESTGGFEPTAVKKVSGLEDYKMDKEGKHLFDVIPFIAGKGNRHADPGFAYFMRVYEVHKVPKPDGGTDRFCCLWSEWKEPCPICTIRRDLPKDEADALRSQVRILFLVNDQPGMLKNPLKLLDAIMYNRKLGFGEQLKLAITTKRGGDQFSNLKGGFQVQSMVSNATYRQVSRIDLLERDYEYPDEWLDKSPCLDDLIIKPNVDVIKALLGQLGASSASVGDDVSDSRHSTSVSVSSDDDAPKKKAAPVAKADDEDDEEEEAPKPAKAAKAPPKAAAPVDDDDDDDDEEEDAAPIPAKKAPSAAAPSANGSLKVGQAGRYKGLEVTIAKISPDGTTLKLKDEDGDVVGNAIPIADFKTIKAEPVAATAKRAPVEDEDLDDDDDDDD